MTNQQIVQLVHEGYHSLEQIAAWAGTTVRRVVEMYVEEYGVEP